MNNPADHLEVLTSMPSSLEASIVVAALRDSGIDAESTGDFTNANRIPTGAWVQVMVTEPDLPLARNTLARLREANAEIDWSKVDVGEPPGDD